MSFTSWLGLLCFVGQVLIFLLSLILSLKYNKASFKLLLVILTCALFSESVGYFKELRHLLFSTSSSRIFSKIEMILEVMSYQFLLGILYKQKLAKKIAFICALTTGFIFALMHYTIEPLTRDFPLISFSLGAIFTILGILYYFYEKIKLQEIEQFSKNFWNCVLAGLLIFLSIEIPFMCVFNYATQHPSFVHHFEIMVNIKLSSSLIYYSSFIFGFIWMKKN